MCDAPYDTILIGSGPASLSCASVLASFGQRVCVLEQHEVIGGGSHTFLVEGRKGAPFDAGLHFTVPEHQYVVQFATGAAAPPVRTPRLPRGQTGGHERIVLTKDPDTTNTADAPKNDFLVRGNPAQLEADLVARFPDKASQIKRYFAVSRAVQVRFAIWMLSALLPAWARERVVQSWPMRTWRQWAAKTAVEGLREIFPGDGARACELRAIVSGLWIDTGCPPSRMSFFMQASVFGGFQELGVAYPAGGPQELALAMAESIEARGGSVLVRALVTRIDLDETGHCRGVLVSDGKKEMRMRASRVISGAGLRATNALLPLPMRRPVERMPNTKQSDSFVMANLIIDPEGASRDELGISAENVWLQPSSEGRIDAFMRTPLEHDVSPALGITFPSAKDKYWPSEGKLETCQILAPARWRPFTWDAHPATDKGEGENTPRGARHAPPHVARSFSYAEKKEEWATMLLGALYETFPALCGKVKHTDISTPLTIQNYLRQGNGAAIGLDVTPARFVDAKEMRKLDMKVGPGLWLCGQDALMCGQVLASVSGIICALRVLGPVGIVRFIARSAWLALGA